MHHLGLLRSPRPSRRWTAEAGRGGLPLDVLALEEGANLGDVAEAAEAGRLVQPELHRHLIGGQQGELFGVGGSGRRAHDTIMDKGCHIEIATS
jgi:hypothetical protein